MFRLAAFGALTLLSASCGGRSRSTDILFEATASVDGKEVRASTVWRVRTSDVFPQGAAISVRGEALAIPVSDGQWVYGLFRVLDANVLGSWPLMLPSVGNAGDAPDRDRASPAQGADTPSSQFDNLIRHLAGRRTEICVPIPHPNQAPSNPCPIFAYFENPADYRYPQIALPREGRRINGHSFRIEHVFVTMGDFNRSAKSVILPPFVKPGSNQTFGKLPGDIKPILDTNLTTSDFWRSE